MSCVRHWFLGDCIGDIAREEIQDSVGGYSEGSPNIGLTKAYGLLPEYGLAHWFAGDNEVNFIHPGITDSSAPFSFAILVRPATSGQGGTRCLLHTGNGAGYLGINTSNQAVFGVNGGTHATGDTLIAGENYLVVGTYDGTSGRVYVAPLLEGVPVAVSGATGMSFGNDHDEGDIGANDSTNFFRGALQGAAIFDDALTADEVEQLQQTGVWTDVTPDVEIAQPLVIDRGIHDDSPIARVAATGVCTLVMDNGQTNTAGLIGYYSPPNANAREGFDRGTPLRVTFQTPGSPVESQIQFIGKIQSIRPIAGIYRERRTFVMATDWMDELARASVQALETQIDLPADDALRYVVDGMRNRPHMIAFDVCDELTAVFDTTTDETITAQQEAVNIVHSEFGTLHVASDGTLVFRSRHARAGDSAVEYTILDAIEILQERATDQIRNRIKVTAHPRVIGDDPLTVLYSTDALSSPADEAILIANGATSEVFLPYTDENEQPQRLGATEVIEPVAGFDYLINSAPDGSSVDLTGHTDIEITFRIGGTGVYMEVVNNYGQPIYFTLLQVRGRPIFNYNPTTAIAEDEDSIDEDGAQELAFDMPYLGDLGVAQGIADFILQEWDGGDTRLTAVTFKGAESDEYRTAGVLGDIGTRVQVEELVSGVAGEYFINAVRVEWKGPVTANETDTDDVDWTWRLSAADTNQYWTLDVSALDLDTVLAPI